MMSTVTKPAEMCSLDVCEGENLRDSLLKTKKRDKRFNNRLGGRLEIDHLEENQRYLLAPNLCFGENKAALTYKEM